MPSIKKPTFGMKKKIVLKDDANEDYELVLEYNAMTPIYYMNCLGRDLLSDFTLATLPKDIKALDNIKGVENIKSEEDLNKLSQQELVKILDVVNTTECSKFLINFISILFYTAHCKIDSSLTFEDIATTYLPDDVLSNEDVMRAVTDILQMKVLSELKKKIKIDN